jgi:hypothetical protein
MAGDGGDRLSSKGGILGQWLTQLWGVLVATLLTLLFFPALYVAWFRVKEPVAGEEGEDARSVAAT